VVRGRKGEFKKELAAWRQRGFTRVRVDGELRSLEDDIVLDKRRNHTLDVVVDRLIVKPGMERRLGESIETALALANDLVVINTWDGGDRLYSRRLACADCGISVPELTPRAFSFNSPHGACGQCQGLGAVYDFDPERVIPDAGRSLAEGAVEPWAKGDVRLVGDALARLHEVHGIDPTVPVRKLSKKAREILLLGAPGAQAPTGRKKKVAADPFGADFEGLLPNLRRRYDAGTWSEREALEPYRALSTCPSCEGARLKAESRAVRVKGHTIVELTSLPVSESSQVFDGLELAPREELVAGRILKEIRERLRFLNDVGVGYLTLARSAVTLSGGEGQRIRLATQIGSSLSGVLYVLDEPSIGLHQRDNRRLLQTLERLRDLGNTVLVVEHDEETIRTADYLVDLGPGAGEHGGELLFQGTPAELLASQDASVTGMYLRGEKTIARSRVRRTAGKAALRITGAREHNLQDLDVSFPLGTFIAVTGVSGSGKSTLVNEILYKRLAKELYRAVDTPGAHDRVDGLQHIDKVIQIDQSPIGRTPRSNPATYIGLFTFLRDLFAMLPESRQRGYKPGRFSFNVKGGRCESCQGDGVLKIEMHFLPDVFVECETCGGKRYNRETLEVKYRGMSIADVLQLTVEQAATELDAIPKVRELLAALARVGLGYLKLGQPATTLSGGEAQRVKLARELGRRSTGSTLYVLDEPTTGLHFSDVELLLVALHGLCEAGNTVIVIEHNLEVIASADWLVDLGPDGGDRGGEIVAMGSPLDVAREGRGATAEAIAPLFAAALEKAPAGQPRPKRATGQPKSRSARS
jgi:excinuclease ABC subunit A